MRTVLFSLLMVLITAEVQAQITVNEAGNRKAMVTLDTIDTKYIHVRLYERVFSAYKICAIDYGQKRKKLQRKSCIRQDDSSKVLFNSEIDMVNFLEQNGWTYKGFDDFVFVFTRNKE